MLGSVVIGAQTGGNRRSPLTLNPGNLGARTVTPTEESCHGDSEIHIFYARERSMPSPAEWLLEQLPRAWHARAPGRHSSPSRFGRGAQRVIAHATATLPRRSAPHAAESRSELLADAVTAVYLHWHERGGGGSWRFRSSGVSDPRSARAASASASSCASAAERHPRHAGLPDAMRLLQLPLRSHVPRL